MRASAWIGLGVGSSKLVLGMLANGSGRAMMDLRDVAITDGEVVS